VSSEGRIISAVTALGAFCVALLAGLGAGNPATTVITHALVAMMVCQVMGLAAGEILAWVRRLHLEEHARRNPVPDVRLTPNAGAGEQNVDKSQ
jgi:hypothetical protein